MLRIYLGSEKQEKRFHLDVDSIVDGYSAMNALASQFGIGVDLEGLMRDLVKMDTSKKAKSVSSEIYTIERLPDPAPVAAPAAAPVKEQGVGNSDRNNALSAPDGGKIYARTTV